LDREEIAALRKSSNPRALVIGGSMSGLFAAILLRGAGCEVAVYERAEVELSGRGAGIVTHAEMRSVLAEAGCDPRHDLGVDVALRRTLDRTGTCLGEVRCPQTLTSWDRVFRMLREQLPPTAYRLGKELIGIAQDGARVTAHCADGSAAEGDLLVGADGFRSTVRAQILPEVQPVYAGYVAWRGLVDEAALPGGTHADIFDAMVFGLPPAEQFISYPIAGPDNDLRPGHRRCNFVWYRPADAAGELPRLLTDARGRTHARGIPPPLVRANTNAQARWNRLATVTPIRRAAVRSLRASSGLSTSRAWPIPIHRTASSFSLESDVRADTVWMSFRVASSLP
jgi:2-polyprenyl-6-methoxyphenol hydroxylase-like FAD-dependent oxidoreductase